MYQAQFLFNYFIFFHSGGMVKWLEIIELRYPVADKKNLERKIGLIKEKINSDVKPYSILIFEHQNFKNQFLIYLKYEEHHSGLWVKSIGRKLVSELAESQLINISYMGD